ncbi:L,D-transpeptidase [Tropicimonas isoalkanivorans]|uniref:L,D-transpeptidase catalytic domain n=1 Tax=Tropicimonas isoalkanivorans TaxID=441112 RepID=A0A1I1KSL7_9RHOB|nr:L,D-transpeptidase [Tropicimonas isoalkanivorans]SFC63731.1 L,D-transpeptidase catalytic domain [Tropicimonas isoalkanivorans]
MPARRRFLLGAAAALCAPSLVRAEQQFELPDEFRAQVVRVRPGFAPGDIHVELGRHFLYFIVGEERAIRYGVAIGSEGRNLSGSAYVGRKAEWPSWTPTANMIRREPQVYAKWAGGLPGGPENPLGARALYLYRGGKDTRYRIHGTPQPWTIGRSVSSGCIRLHNDHVIDLYERVPVGTSVTFH